MSWGMRKTPARKRRDAMKRDELQTKIEEDKLLEFTMACEDGDPDGCFSLAEWHAIVDKNHEKAASMYMENCLTRAHGASCHHMGLLHVNGRGVPRSRSKALEFMSRACAVDHPDGCGVGGMLAMRKVRKAAARQSGGPVPSSSGSTNDGDSSGRTGACATGAGPRPDAGVAREASAAMDMLRKGCDLGCASACAYLGGVLLGGDASIGVSSEPAAAVAPLKAGCEGNDGSSCHNLAVLFRRGAPGVQRDASLASEYLAQAKKLFASAKSR